MIKLSVINILYLIELVKIFFEAVSFCRRLDFFCFYGFPLVNLDSQDYFAVLYIPAIFVNYL